MLNQAFYDLALNNEYPFDDSSSLIDSSGRRLPEGLLCDLSCVIDSTIANRIFCSAVTKSGNFCSIVFSADNEAQTALGFISFDLTRQDVYFLEGISPQRRLTALVPGFSGSIVVGEQWSQIPDGVWRFATADDSLVAARCCFPVRLPSRQTIVTNSGSRALAGVVDISPEGDLIATVATRRLAGQDRQAIVFSLRPDSNLLARYAGPNQARPESRSCGDPQPVETINNVAPDCCGRIYIELRGCAQPIPISNFCGVVLDCPLTLSEICPTPVRYDEQDNPDTCLAGGAGDPLSLPSGLPTLPPNW